MVWFRRAAEQGHAEAQYQLSLAYLNGGEASAIGWYRRAAAVDMEIAERNRELIFPNGLTVRRTRPKHCAGAVPRRSRASAMPQANLGLMYARGLGCELDYVEARRWYLAAAAQGNAAAELGLGVIYANGFGVESDPTAGAAWYEKAAAKGNPDAQVALALMCDAGQGLARDPARAAALFSRRPSAAIRGLATISRCTSSRATACRRTGSWPKPICGRRRTAAMRRRC